MEIMISLTFRYHICSNEDKIIFINLDMNF